MLFTPLQFLAYDLEGGTIPAGVRWIERATESLFLFLIFFSPRRSLLRSFSPHLQSPGEQCAPTSLTHLPARYSAYIYICSPTCSDLRGRYFGDRRSFFKELKAHAEWSWRGQFALS